MNTTTYQTQEINFAIVDKKNIVVNLGIATQTLDLMALEKYFFTKYSQIYSPAYGDIPSEEYLERGITNDSFTTKDPLTDKDIQIYEGNAIQIMPDMSNIICCGDNETSDHAVCNFPFFGAYYDSNLNAFIPPKPDETYILNENTFEWEPNPELTYDIHNDGKLYQYLPETKQWIPTWEPENFIES